MIVGITGANGFIGKNLVKYLNDKKYETLDFDLYCNSITTRQPMVSAFVKHCDVIVHLAGKNKGEDEDILDVNILGTYNLAKQCLQLSKPLVFAGSLYKKCDAYKCSKEISYEILKNFKHLGLDSSVLYLPKVFGPGCKPFYNSFVSTMLYSAANNKEYKSLIKDPNEILSLIYVDDVCQLFENYINKLNFVTAFEYTDFVCISDIVDIIEGKDVPSYRAFPKFCENIKKTLESYREQSK